MLLKPKNRRKSSEGHRRWLPAFDWRRWAMTGASLIGVLAAVGVVAWALNQPIESVSVEGRFQRVSPADVERAVKQRVRGAGLVSVKLSEVQAAVRALPWVDRVSVQRAWPRGLRVSV